LYKKHKDYNYKLGKTPNESADFHDLSKKISEYTKIKKTYIDKIIFSIIMLGFTVIFYRILKYKTIKPYYIVVLNIIFVIFYYIINRNKNYVYNNKYEKIYSIFIIISIIIIYYKNKK
jgi:hypothetical protein